MANAINTPRETDVRSPSTHRPEMEETAKVAEKAKELATAVTDKSKELAAAVAQAAGGMAKDAASAVAQRAGDAASTVGRTAEDATSAFGGNIESLGHTLREKAPHDGMLGTASCAVAGTLESSGRYIKEQGLTGIGEDLNTLIHRYPMQSVLIGIGIGFGMARFTRS